MRILLVNNFIRGSVSNEETFWSVLADKLENTSTIELHGFKKDLSSEIARINPDILIHNSVLGAIDRPKKTKSIVLLQDNFVEMDKILPKSWKEKLKKLLTEKNFYSEMIRQQRQAMVEADKVVAVSRSVADSYGVGAEIIPIGVNADIFKPLDNKDSLRRVYGLPKNKQICIFVGSQHSVKGFDLLEKEVRSNKDKYYIIVLKDDVLPRHKFSNASYFNKIPQEELCRLYNCADEYVGFSRVETLWLAPIEAMFCGVPVRVTSVGLFANWTPNNEDPRAEGFKLGLDQETMITKWDNLISSVEQ